jgi:hypothetical protein
MWKRSQAFHCRPSELLGLEDKLIAYFFDRGIWFFGSHVESEVDKAGEGAARGVKSKGNREALVNGARQRALDKLLDGKTAKSKFRDPMASGVVK